MQPIFIKYILPVIRVGHINIYRHWRMWRDHGCLHVCVNELLFADVDECDGDHGCLHVCVNDDGSFHCECNDGFNLDVDGQTCNGKKWLCSKSA